jgi:hypothetical protein
MFFSATLQQTRPQQRTMYQIERLAAFAGSEFMNGTVLLSLSKPL